MTLKDVPRSVSVLPASDELMMELANIRSAFKPAPSPRAMLCVGCACGGTVESELDEQSIELAVQAHQRQPEHRDYVALEQLAGRFVARQALLLDYRRVS